jgi:hypothetical protein
MFCVMAGLVGVPARKRAGCPVPAIHVFIALRGCKDVDARESAGLTAERVARDALLVGLFDDVGDLVGLGVDNDDRAVGHKKPVRAQRRDLLR